MAFTNKSYCSLDDVRQLLSTPDSDTTDDDTILAWIPQAQAVIDEYLGFSFQTDGTDAAPATRTYDGNGREKILIDRCLSLVSVTTTTFVITFDSAQNKYVRTASTPIDITADCDLGPTGLEAGFMLTRETGYFPLGKKNVTVTGTFGKFATIPGDIRRACARLTVHFLKQRDNAYQDQTGNSQFGQLTFRQQIPADVCQTLDQHKPKVFYS